MTKSTFDQAKFDRDVARSIEMAGYDKPVVLMCQSGEMSVQLNRQDPTKFMFGKRI